jgi:hypothetical protein
MERVTDKINQYTNNIRTNKQTIKSQLHSHQFDPCL